MLWRAFSCLLLLAAPWLPAASPPLRAPDLAQVGKPDAAEAARLLEQFRGAGLPGEYFFTFTLQSLPRRGPERSFQGRYWGGRNEHGAIVRVELSDADGRTHRLLLQNGEKARVWRWSGDAVEEVPVARWFEPLVPGVEVTAFDVQMPFLYWPEASLERISRIRGRPAHAFIFRAPEAFAQAQPDVAAARAYLDTQFNALLQTELLAANGRVLKTFSLLSLKTIDRQPLPKTADYRNEATRDKTRLLVREAALDLELPDKVFSPENLAQPVATPPGLVSLER